MPVVSKARSYVHHSMGSLQLAQQTEIRRILRSTDAQAKLTVGQPLSKSERTYFEPRFGRDFCQMRVNADTRAVEVARAVNAQAFTVGQDVVFGAGQYAPESSTGQRLMAHELTHVVQQSGKK